MITGVQSALTSAGATTPAEFHQRAVIGVQTHGGHGEGKPRGQVLAIGPTCPNRHAVSACRLDGEPSMPQAQLASTDGCESV